MITIKQIIERIKEIVDNDPRVNYFSCGPAYEFNQDVQYYPYVYVMMNQSQRLVYSDQINGYNKIEYSFVISCGDKVNDQENVYSKNGVWSNNGLDASSNSFDILIDILNCISTDSLGYIGWLDLQYDISIDPFWNAGAGDENGWSAYITLTGVNDNSCVSPITDN